MVRRKDCLLVNAFLLDINCSVFDFFKGKLGRFKSFALFLYISFGLVLGFVSFC